jgi:hypothetical protein
MWLQILKLYMRYAVWFHMLVSAALSAIYNHIDLVYERYVAAVAQARRL